jgi:hypothetical protein
MAPKCRLIRKLGGTSRAPEMERGIGVKKAAVVVHVICFFLFFCLPFPSLVMDQKAMPSPVDRIVELRGAKMALDGQSGLIS